MQHRQYEPHLNLANIVQCVWTSSRDFSAHHGALDILPDSYVELIFNFGAAWDIELQQTHLEVASPYVVGLLDKPFRLQADGQLSTVGVRFFAWGFAALTGIQVETNQILPLTSRFWRSAHQRLEHAVNTNNGELAVRLLQDTLLTLTAPARHDVSPLQQASQLLLTDQTMTVEMLAAHCHLSRRQLERQFSRSIGIPPKTLARTLRFQVARDRLCQQPTLNLSDLALQSGYADQAHLTHEFKQYSRRTPGRFAAEIVREQEPLRYGVAFSK